MTCFWYSQLHDLLLFVGEDGNLVDGLIAADGRVDVEADGVRGGEQTPADALLQLRFLFVRHSAVMNGSDGRTNEYFQLTGRTVERVKMMMMKMMTEDG